MGTRPALNPYWQICRHSACRLSCFTLRQPYHGASERLGICPFTVFNRNGVVHLSIRSKPFLLRCVLESMRHFPQHASYCHRAHLWQNHHCIVPRRLEFGSLFRCIDRIHHDCQQYPPVHPFLYGSRCDCLHRILRTQLLAGRPGETIRGGGKQEREERGSCPAELYPQTGTVTAPIWIGRTIRVGCRECHV